MNLSGTACVETMSGAEKRAVEIERKPKQAGSGLSEGLGNLIVAF